MHEIASGRSTENLLPRSTLVRALSTLENKYKKLNNNIKATKYKTK